jgi:hypothetical protein
MPEPVSPQPQQNSDPATPDLFLVTGSGPRLPDGGPIYKETPHDPAALTPGQIAEPWNTATAFLFVLIVLFWAVRLRNRYRHYLFVVTCLPILLAGGIGGTLYHMHRSRYAYFILDVIPIYLLGLAAAVYLVLRLGQKASKMRIAWTVLGAVGASVFVNLVLFQGLVGRSGNPHWVVNLSYASLAAVILIPLFLVQLKTRFRQYGLVLAALACFAIAWFMRLADNSFYGDLPMGTHWLWHIFGALTTFALMEYFYRLESENIL